MSVYPLPAYAQQVPTPIERCGFAILFFALCSLFTGVQFDSPLLIIKPFDIVALIVLPPLLLLAIGRGTLPRSFGLVLVVTFFAVHIGSALSVSEKNGIKEFIQISEHMMLASVLALYRSELDWDRMARLFLVISGIIVTGSVLWHLTHGFYVGWKRLDEPKLLFSYALPVLFAIMLSSGARARIYDYLLLSGVGLFLLLSGERKALLAFFVCLMILTIVGFARLIPLILCLLVGGGLVSATLLSDTYLASQVHSFSTLGTASEVTVGELMSPDPELSLSNAQRAFSLRVSEDLIAQSPVFGIGTNAYVPYVAGLYSNYPSFLLVGIHNEFQRVLVENGLVGLFFYLIPWMRTAVYGIGVRTHFGSRHAAVYAMFYTVLLFQCFFEGGGNEAFLAFIMMALLPEFFDARLRYQSPE